MENILTVSRLNKSYGNTHALKDLDLDIKKGQVWGILGPNGSGKTTALGIILGVLRPSSGSYSWFDQGQASFLRRSIGSILEQPNFFPWMTAERQLYMTALQRGLNHPAALIEKALKTVHLFEHRNETFKTFSLGMKQRLALAACILGQPKVLVLDEPTNGIDAEGIALVRSIIKELADQGTTILLASHILDEVEKVCSHVVILKEGRVLDRGPIEQVLSQDDWLEVRAFDVSKESLLEMLKSFPYQRGLSYTDTGVKVILDQDKDPRDVNQFLAAKGLFLSHLMRHKGSLENHFLKLLEESRRS